MQSQRGLICSPHLAQGKRCKKKMKIKIKSKIVYYITGQGNTYHTQNMYEYVPLTYNPLTASYHTSSKQQHF